MADNENGLVPFAWASAITGVMALVIAALWRTSRTDSKEERDRILDEQKRLVDDRNKAMEKVTDMGETQRAMADAMLLQAEQLREQKQEIQSLHVKFDAMLARLKVMG